MADDPGVERHREVRNRFRPAGFVLVAVGGILLLVGVGSLLATMGSDSIAGPSYFWMAFVGMPLLAAGGWCLQAGFLGVATARCCAQCGHGEDADARYCSTCGSALA